MTKYDVPIVYRGQVNFIVEAESEDAAREIARARFNANDKEDVLGNEWEEIERFGEVAEVYDAAGGDCVSGARPTAQRSQEPAHRRYDHTMELGFSVASGTEDGSDISPAMFRAALMQRIADLDAAGEWVEVIGVPLDTIDVSEITLPESGTSEHYDLKAWHPGLLKGGDDASR